MTGFEGPEVVVDLEGATGTHPFAGRIVRDELSWRRAEDPAEIVKVGQRIEVEVIGVDWRRERVLLSAKACQDQALRAFLVGIQPGDVLTGTVADVRNFGVFVNLDGEPADNCTELNGTGFIWVPELSWSHIDHPSDVVLRFSFGGSLSDAAAPRLNDQTHTERPILVVPHPGCGSAR